MIWIADAHCDGKRFVVRADKNLTAFLELEVALLRLAIRCPWRLVRLARSSSGAPLPPIRPAQLRHAGEPGR